MESRRELEAGCHGGQVRDAETLYYSLMRAAWWWIDRWRNSTAFISMSAEEQGLYRNLLDAVWIFDDGIIPADRKSLISASGGDTEAWDRSGERVLKWMQRKDHGWTNLTAIEVKAKSSSISNERSKAGAKGAAKREANRHSKPMSPSKDKSLDQEPSKAPTNERQRIAPPSEGAFAFPSQRAADLFLKHYPEGKPAPAMFKVLRPLVEKHGWPKVGPELEAYLQGTEVTYHSWPKFASGFGSWANGTTRKNVSAVGAQNRSAADGFLTMVNEIIDGKAKA